MSAPNYVVLACATALTLPACAQLLGFEDVEPAGTQQDAAPSIDASGPDAAPDPLACAQQDFTPAIGTASGSNESTPNERDLSCGSENANDLLLAWRAPVTDYYVFSSEGSDFDTVLGLFEGCDGEEFACNNNVDGASTSELVLKIEQDTDVLVAVDGFASDTGSVALEVERVSCPDSDLAGQTLPLSLSSTGFGDDFSNSCGGEGNDDRAYHYVAPTDGLYAFTAVGESHSPIITVIDGSRCEDQELGCNRAAEPGFTSQVVRRLTEGQELSVYVDGRDGAGPFDLDIQPVEATCPESSLSKGNMLIGSYTSRTMSSSCSFTEARNSINVRQERNDATFLVEVPNAGLGCFGSCDIQITSGEPFSAALLENGDCSGAELVCEPSTANAVLIPAGMDETETTERTLIISNMSNTAEANFTVSMFCAVACA